MPYFYLYNSKSKSKIQPKTKNNLSKNNPSKNSLPGLKIAWIWTKNQSGILL